MESKRLSECLDERLRDVELYSRASNKFEGLQLALAALWRVAPSDIGIKYLNDAKNVGNRIAEATRRRIRFLVLLAEKSPSSGAVRRALESKALFVVPTLLIVRNRGAGWQPLCRFGVPESATPFDDEAPLTSIVPPRSPDVRGNVLDSIRLGVLGLASAPIETDIDGALAELDGGRGLVVVKHVQDSKNLANRAGEGLALRPAVCVLVLPKEIRAMARRVVSNLLCATPGTAAFAVSPETGSISVEEIQSLGDAELAPSSEGGSLGSTPFVNLGEHQVSEAEPPVQPAADKRSYRRLERVKQLHRHLPLNAGADRLYEEHQGSGDRLRYETRTLGFIRELLAAPDRKVIVLTGNAGHGKTHMCRRLLEDDPDVDDVMARLAESRDGGVDWQVQGAGLPVRVIKDLSEIDPPDHAAQRLEALIQQEHAHVLVCANEGRLRDVASHRPTHLSPLLRALEAGVKHGKTSPDGHPDVHVVNLNNQASSADGGGFLGHVLDHFLNHEGAWRVCGSCLASDRCPILRNRKDLGVSPSLPETSARQRAAFLELVRIVEEGGYVLTYRETLVLVAYAVTGGVTCEEVERLHKSRRPQRLDRHRLLSLLFDRQLTEDQEQVLRVLDRFRRLDPGRVALRPVDERLHQELEASGALGRGLFGDSERQLHSSSALKEEAEKHRLELRDARRSAWLDSEDGTDGVRRSQRLGLRHHRAFRDLHAQPEDSVMISILRQLVSGLHTVQGAVGIDSRTSLHLVDPAFGRSGSHSAVIATSIRIKDLQLRTESDWWACRAGGERPSALASVEWIDRRIVLVGATDETELLALDLLSFEFVMNASRGVVMRDFHSAERRRVLRALARRAEAGATENDDIRVLLDRGEGTLTVERDGTILLEKSV